MEALFTYLDYRDFIRDYYEDHKRQFGWFSYRYIALHTGIDVSFLSKVIKKRLHLASRSIGPMMRFLCLQDSEAEYFEALVRFNKASKAAEAQRCFEKLIALRPPSANPLDRSRDGFRFSWHSIAIYELLSFFPYRDADAPALAQALIPPISIAACRQAITFLETLQLIRKEPDGFYRHVKTATAAGEHQRAAGIPSVQKEVLQRGLEALGSIAVEQRDISTLTLSLSRKSVDLLKARLREISQEFMQIARGSVTPTEVYQVNLELFALTRVADRGSVQTAADVHES
jgi:uncharacterized protein (TIGR02147 family)